MKFSPGVPLRWLCLLSMIWSYALTHRDRDVVVYMFFSP